jgi:hypothetical protein
MARVVLEVGPRAREGDALAAAILKQDMVDELRTVVAIQPQDAKWQISLQPL